MRLFGTIIVVVAVNAVLSTITSYESVLVVGISYLIANRICDDLDKEENLEK